MGKREEREIKIIYRPPVFNTRHSGSPYEVRCEGLQSGWGDTLQEAIEDFDYNNG